MLTGGGVDFFGVQVQRARVGQELLAQGTGTVGLADHGQGAY